MLENLSPTSRECFDAAKREARRLKHADLNTRHLLLGLLNRQQAAIDRLLQPYALNAAQVTQAIVGEIGDGDTPSPRLLKVSPGLKATLMGAFSSEKETQRECHTRGYRRLL